MIAAVAGGVTIITLIARGLGGGERAPKGDVSMVPAALDFGRISVGRDASNIVTIGNSLSRSVSLTSLRIDGNSFSLPESPSLPIQIAPGEKYTLQIQFDPKRKGKTSGKLRCIFESNSPGQRPKTYEISTKLTGTGGT